MKQILEGLVYLHDNNIIHRDIKGANILVKDNGVVKLADFGLARIIQPEKNREYTIKVVTMWYRPPELLLGHKKYSKSVDMWSVGVFFVELFTGKPLFNASNELEQLKMIFEFCGSPNETNFTDFNLLEKSVKEM